MTRLLVLLPLLAGCAGNPLTDDPINRVGTWAPEGVNEANLRVMVADPHDLLGGTGASTSLGAEAAPPVGLLLSGRRATLPGTDFNPGGGAPAPSQGGSNNAGPQ
jgi:hypothetical protein